MSSPKMPLLLIILAIVLVLASLWGNYTRIVRPLPNCEDMDFFEESHNWEIMSSNIDSEILWQISDINLPPPAHSGFPSTAFAATDSTVLYLRLDGLPCSSTQIVIAFDTATGEELWRYEFADGITHIFAVSEGYILFHVSSMTKLDFAGRLIWRNTDYRSIPLRSFSTMTEINGDLYFPDQFGTTYIISGETGEVVDLITDENAVAWWHDKVLIETASNQLEVWARESRLHFQYSLDLPPDLFRNISLNTIYPFPLRYGNTLLLFFNSTQVRAYNLATGDLTWTIEEAIYGVPTLVGDLLAIYRANNVLELRIPETGEIVGQIELDLSPTSQADSRFSIWITGNDDTVFIRQVDVGELIAVRLDVAETPSRQ